MPSASFSSSGAVDGGESAGGGAAVVGACKEMARAGILGLRLLGRLTSSAAAERLAREPTLARGVEL